MSGQRYVNEARVAVTREHLSVTDPRIGVDFDDPGDQGAKLQAAFNLAGESSGRDLVVYIAGHVVSGIELVAPGESDGRKTIKIRGAGSNDSEAAAPSAIMWRNDLGAGKYALKLPRTATPTVVEGLAFIGPGGVTARGDFPSVMRGIRMAGRHTLRDVRCTKFGSGIALYNDHQQLYDVDVRGNGYGLDFIDVGLDGTPAFGDQFFVRLAADNCTRASIAICDTNAILNARFISGHAGYGPFGVFRYANTRGAAANALAMAGVQFANFSWELCRHSIFRDQPAADGGQGAQWQAIFAEPNIADPFAGEPWPGMTDTAMYDVGTCELIWLTGGPGDPLYPFPIVKASSITLVAPNWSANAAATYNAPGTKNWFVLRGAYNASGQETEGGISLGHPGRSRNGIFATCRVVDEAVARGDLMERNGAGHARKARNDDSSLILGFAADAAVQGQVAVIYERNDHYSAVVSNKTGASIAANRLLKPDPANAGGVIAASAADAQIVGIVTGAALAANTTGRAYIRV